MALSIPELRSRLSGLATADRIGLGARLRRVERSTASAEVERIAADLERAEARVDQRRSAVPETITYPEDLPISLWRDEIVESIRRNQVVVIAGETGSGKSTQLPKMCVELGRGIDGTIGHTQPRRIAARSIAERVAEEMRTEVGAAVGYTVRFTDEVSDGTLVKVMTDGILLNEIQRDPDLLRYDTIIVDEAHERSLTIDFLIGYLKQLLPRRRDLKVIITSATIDTERFSAHFDDAPVIEVTGRTYPVEVRYRPLDDPRYPEARDQSQAICDAVVELAAASNDDILVFCSGEREIRDAIDALRDLDLRHTEILPLFGRLSAGEQHRIFAPHTGRRVVVATNVAETSLTVPGIRSVVDAGMARISRYNRRTKVQRLPIEAISRASADQRAGRCGRLGPGVCIRLYAEQDYAGRPEFTDPEILRTNLASVMLQMAAVGLGDVEDFPFIELPDTRAIRDGAALLQELGAVGDARPGTRGWLTDIGRSLARLPVDPRIGRMLLAADVEGCLDEVLTIAAALSIQDPRERPLGKEQAADEKHGRFIDTDSDFATWLRLFEYISSERRDRTSNQFRRMCRDEFLNWRRLREWQDLRAQLDRVTRDMRMRRNRKPAAAETVIDALLAGLLSQIGHKDPDGHEYRGARGTRFAIRPGSALFKRNPEWIMAAELVETTRLWATGVAAIDVETLERVGSHLIKRSISEPWWDAQRGAAVGRETVTLFGIQLRTDRVVQYGRFDEVVARDLFIRNALVAGDWDTHHQFAAHNRDRIEDVLAMEARARRGDLFLPDDDIVAWFDTRLPSDIVSAGHFDRWWNRTRASEPHLLDLDVDDLMSPEAEGIDDEAFPETWEYGDLSLELTYEFDPASESDGLTVDVPLDGLDRIDPTVFGWNVPGLRVELVEALIRSLPKQVRREFAPIGDTARQIAAELEPDGNVIVTVCRHLARRSGIPVTPDDIDADRIPQHLRPRYRVVDVTGDVLGEGPDLAVLRDGLRRRARETVKAARHPVERDAVTSWDFDELPRQVAVGTDHPVTAYPALVDGGDSVSIRLLATADEQAEAMWTGTRRLILESLPSPTRLLRSVLDREVGLALVGGPYAGRAEWMDDCLDCSLDAVIADHGGPAWTREAFEDLVIGVRDGLADQIEAVGSDSARILEALQRCEIAVEGRTGSAFSDVAEDVRHQLDRFVFPGFLAAVGADRLSDVRRYVEAAARRLETVAENPGRDRLLMERIEALEDEFDRLSEILPVTPEMLDVSWMLQELRVSFFAQSVGVKGQVSEKRVRKAIAHLLTG